MKRNKNPLTGKVGWTKDFMWLKKGIKFGGQMNPKIKPREWFYLLYFGNIESFRKNTPKEKQEQILQSCIGSRATQWRIKKKLIKKGYL
ncbi:hypothetical protein L6Q79_16050 [bacterium]|nr:hypothetical protein [Candidatus Paceibacterota bacterium]MCK6544181.1 hypothetical protein [bacterium]NUQ57513.1 hypothetical protein [Candidatus Paceibacter sp.]